MTLGRRRWNVSDSYTKTWQHIRSANISLESSIRGLFGDIIALKINVGVYEKLAKSNDSSTKTQMHAAKCWRPWCADSRRHRRRAACTFISERYGHCWCWLQPAATRPVPKLLWAYLLDNVSNGLSVIFALPSCWTEMVYLPVTVRAVNNFLKNYFFCSQ